MPLYLRTNCHSSISKGHTCPLTDQTALQTDICREQSVFLRWKERKEKTQCFTYTKSGLKIRPPGFEEQPKAESFALLIIDLRDNRRTRLWPKAIALTWHLCPWIDFHSFSLSYNSIKAFNPEEETSKLCITILSVTDLDSKLMRN